MTTKAKTPKPPKPDPVPANCLHCGMRPKHKSRRGMCRTCHETPGLRDLYPMRRASSRGLVTMQGLPDAVRGYLAGLIDGEGTIGVNRSKHPGQRKLVYRLLVRVTSTTFSVLEWLKAVTGIGCIVFRSGLARRRLDCGTWVVSSANAVAFLKSIYPFLIIKRRQADLAIAWMQTRDGRTPVDSAAAERFRSAIARLSLRGLYQSKYASPQQQTSRG